MNEKSDIPEVLFSIKKTRINKSKTLLAPRGKKNIICQKVLGDFIRKF